jgi:hypothetical protein
MAKTTAKTTKAAASTATPNPNSSPQVEVIPVNHDDIMKMLHIAWNELVKLGHDAEHEFMHFINHKITGKSMDEVKQATVDAQNKAAAAKTADAGPTVETKNLTGSDTSTGKPAAS